MKRASCHPEKKHVAHGLCATCYYRDGNKARSECHPDKPNYAHGLCRTCYQRRYKRANPQKESPTKSLCHPDRAQHADGVCLQCYGKRHQEKYYTTASGRKSRRESGWRKQGMDLTVKEWEEMATSQEHRCAICRSYAKLEADHDHSTGKVRGLLCRKCNSGIGFFCDSEELLREASEYMSRNAAILEVA